MLSSRRRSFLPLSLSLSLLLAVKPRLFSFAPSSCWSTLSDREVRVKTWIERYRDFAHLRAQIDPLHLTARPSLDQLRLNPSFYGVEEEEGGERERERGRLHESLEASYAGSIGYELSRLPDSEREWFTERIEACAGHYSSTLNPSQRRNSFALLLQSECFDHFLAKRFPTFKRYGLEGCEAALPAFHEIFAGAQRHQVQQIVLAMPHRGRLNVLVSLLNYPLRALFHKIKGGSLIPADMQGIDDVASHISHSVEKRFDSNEASNLHISLLPNPSHLEAINAVALGKTCSEQEHAENRSKVACLIVHGDAALAGQGINMECLTLSKLAGFDVGGTVHLVVNNQIGFTTTQHKARSSTYATDIFHSLSSPILHVNGEDIDAVLFASKLAIDYQQKFHRDICLDLIGFRRRGHNELDDATLTQPLMYQTIANRPSVVSLYAAQLQKQHLDSSDHAESLQRKFNSHLEVEFNGSTTWSPSSASYFQNAWAGFTQPQHCFDQLDTGVALPVLKQVAKDSVRVPEGFALHPRLRKSHVDERLVAIEQRNKIDFPTAEMIAFGSLLVEGHSLRIVGQDVERGTFSHRHAVMHDQQTNAPYIPFEECGYQGRCQFVSSPLSEYCVVGFELGFSWTSPSTLCVCEMQFGDFCNTAQPIIDNFIVNTEHKWLKQSGLVLTLPHGMNGAGAEHSSGKLERFLQLSDDASDVSLEARPVNIVVAYPSTPSQYFHLLRRQQLRPYRKPLIVMSPKVMLRLEAAVSDLQEMVKGSRFYSVLNDNDVRTKDVNCIKTILICTGESYYSLCNRRNELKRDDIAFVRIEELSPFPFASLQNVLKLYPLAKTVSFYQEEHRNQGAWNYLRPRLEKTLSGLHWTGELKCISRKPLSASAVGSSMEHKKEADYLLQQAFAFNTV